MRFRHIQLHRSFLLFVVATVGPLTVLNGCALMEGRLSESVDEKVVFVPPTLAVSPLVGAATQAPVAAPREALSPTATPVCMNNLTYLRDITIPDGAIVKSGEGLDKRWAVQNRGSCNWDERYTLRLIGGSEMGASEKQALYPARSGAEATIRIVFMAPLSPGIQRSTWQAHDPAGQPFGDAIFVEINVIEQNDEGGE